MRPSEIRIPVGYPNDDPSNGAGMSQRDFDDGQIGGDSLRTIVELLTMATFNRLEPEFQRRYIAMAVAAWVEAGLILGVGTGWRDWDTQMANWKRDSRQFANPLYSLHVNRGPYDVAYAIDTVPYDVLNWAHKNCDRFGINYLEHIPHERHHCQVGGAPNGGSQFRDSHAHAARTVLDLPYLGTRSLAEWLAADAPITLNPNTPTPEPEPPAPTPTEDDMALLAKGSDNTQYVLPLDLSTKLWVWDATAAALEATGRYVRVSLDDATLARIEDARVAGDSAVNQA